MNCVFCEILEGNIPSKKIYEDELVVAIMDIEPVVDGHILVIPKKHVTDYTELDETLRNHIYEVAKKLSNQIMEKLNSKGMTFTVNYGESQMVKHFHLHLLPDYQIKVKEKSIDEVYELLTK